MDYNSASTVAATTTSTNSNHQTANNTTNTNNNSANRLFDTDTESLLNEINNLQNTSDSTNGINGINTFQTQQQQQQQSSYFYNQTQQAKYNMYGQQVPPSSTSQTTTTTAGPQTQPTSPQTTANNQTQSTTTIQNVQINVQNNFNLAKNINQANLNQFSNTINPSQVPGTQPVPSATPNASTQSTNWNGYNAYAQPQSTNYTPMYTQQTNGGPYASYNNGTTPKYPQYSHQPQYPNQMAYQGASQKMPPIQQPQSTPNIQQQQPNTYNGVKPTPSLPAVQPSAQPNYYGQQSTQRPPFYPQSNQPYNQTQVGPPPVSTNRPMVPPQNAQPNLYATQQNPQQPSQQNMYMNQQSKFTNYQHPPQSHYQHQYNQPPQYPSYNHQYQQPLAPPIPSQPMYTNGGMSPMPQTQIQQTTVDQNTPLKSNTNKQQKSQKASKTKQAKNNAKNGNTSIDESGNGTNDSLVNSNSPSQIQQPHPPGYSAQYGLHEPFSIPPQPTQYHPHPPSQHNSFIYPSQHPPQVNGQQKPPFPTHDSNIDYTSNIISQSTDSFRTQPQSHMVPHNHNTTQIRPIMHTPPITYPNQPQQNVHTNQQQQTIVPPPHLPIHPQSQQTLQIHPPQIPLQSNGLAQTSLTSPIPPQTQVSQLQHPQSIVHSQANTNFSQLPVNNFTSSSIAEPKLSSVNVTLAQNQSQNEDKSIKGDMNIDKPLETVNEVNQLIPVQNNDEKLTNEQQNLDLNETNNSSTQNQDSLNEDNDEDFDPTDELNEVKPKRGRGRRPGVKNKSPKKQKDGETKVGRKPRRKTIESEHNSNTEQVADKLEKPILSPSHAQKSENDDLVTISSLSQENDSQNQLQVQQVTIEEDDGKPKRKYARKKASLNETINEQPAVQLGEEAPTTADELDQAKKPRVKHRRKNTKQLASLLKKKQRKKRKLSSDEEDDDDSADEYQLSAARAKELSKSLIVDSQNNGCEQTNDVSQSTGSYSIETDEQTAKALQANEKRRSARAAASKKQKYTLDDNAFKMAVLDDKVIESDGEDKEVNQVPNGTNFVLTTNDSFIVDKILGNRMNKRKLFKKKEKPPKVELPQPEEKKINEEQKEQNGDVEMKDENEETSKTEELKEEQNQSGEKKDEEKNKEEDIASSSEEEEECGEIEVEEYFVKYKNISYLHSEWRSRDELFQTDKRIDQKIKRYKQKKSQAINFGDEDGVCGEDEDELFNPDYVEIDRILDTYSVTDPNNPDGEQLNYYLVKWKVLPYEEATWELAQDLNKKKIERFHEINILPSDTKFIPKPRLDRWAQMKESRTYKNGNTLREYQLEGINWLTYCWLQGRNCILADEMGLGKTVQSITFLQEVAHYGVNGPYLVIVPLSTIGNWIREFETWTNFNVIVYHGSSVSRNLIQDYEFYYKDHQNIKNLKNYPKFNALITTFEVLLSDVQLFAQFKWRNLIIDEAHRLKNKNCKLIEGLRCVDCEHKVLLTGTPLQNNVEELFSLLNYLEPDQFNSSQEFLQEFGDLKTDTQVTKLQAILKPMMLRRLKEDVEKNLAPKEETIIEVELTNIQKKYYRAILEKNFQFLSRGASSSNVPNLMNTMMELRKCCNHPYLINGAEEQILIDYCPKGQASDEVALKAMVHASGKLVLVDKLLPKLKAGGHKVLIFSQMIRVLDILEDYLIQNRLSYERLDGRIRGEMRQEAIDRFSKPDSDRFAFLLCTRAGGLGINLTAADTVIIYDSDWNPQNDLQAQARVHRIGQQKSVKIYRLVTRNTYEREMFDRASLKLGLDKAVLQSMRNDEKFNTTNQNQNGQMSKKEIEDLLKKGAYGAIMEDDNAGDKFCEEDIDKILQQRATVVTIEGGEKGSTFSKASFSASETRSDISLDDPEFWQKWAKKAEIDVEASLPKDERIIYEPRRRTQTKRFGGPEDFDESESDSSDTNDGEEGGKKRGRKGKKGNKDDNSSNYPPENAWSRDECYKVEKNLLIYGWSQWSKILYHCKRANKKRIKDESDIEFISRLILVYALQHYHGDDAIKQFIIDLIDPSKSNDFKNHHGLAAPVPRGRKSKKLDEQPQNGQESSSNILNDSEWKRHSEDLIADDNYKKHLVRQANKILLRVRMLFYIKQEIIGNEIANQIEEGINANDIDLHVPTIQANEIPSPWWDKECDKSLILGVYKFGYEKYNQMRMDPCLCFLALCGPPDAKDLLAEQQDDEKADQMEDEDGEYKPANEKRILKSLDDDIDDEENNENIIDLKKNNNTKNSSGKFTFPQPNELNIRLRRIITTFQKHHKKEILLSKRNAERQEKRMSKLASHQEKVTLKQIEKQSKWSRREETNFYRTISSFGIDYDKNTNTYSWDRFRELGQLDKKLDDTLTDYFNSFYYMCKKVCNKLTDDEEPPQNDIIVEAITEERASRCLQRIDLLNRLRNEVKDKEQLDERLKLCKPSIDLPDWWVPVKHDRDLALAAAKYGINRTEHFYLNDPELSFKEYLNRYMKHIESMIGDSKIDPIQYYFLNQVKIQTSFKELLEIEQNPKQEEQNIEMKDENKNDETLKEPEEEPTKVDVSVESEPSQLQICEDDEANEKMEIVEDNPTEEQKQEDQTTKSTDNECQKLESGEIKNSDEPKLENLVERNDNPQEEEMKVETKEETKLEIDVKQEQQPSMIDLSSLTNESLKQQQQLSSNGQSFPMIMWPKDRIIFNRLENIVHCLENNEWPERALYSIQNQPLSQSASDKAPASPIPSTTSDFDNDQISNAGDFEGIKPSSSSSTSGKYQKPKRGRPPKLEDPTNKIRQMLTQMADENDLQLPLAELMNAAKNSIFAAMSQNSPSPIPPFLEPGEIVRKSNGNANSNGINKDKKSKTSKQPKPSLDPLASALSLFMQPGVDPDERIPVINMDGTRLTGDDAPKRSDLTDWLLQHPNFLPDQPDIYELAFGKRSSSVKPPKSDQGSFIPPINRSPSPTQRSVSNEKHVKQQSSNKIQPDPNIANLNFINKISGKRLNPEKRPSWKNICTFLERNQDLYIDSNSVDIIKSKYGKNYPEIIKSRILPPNFKSTQKSSSQSTSQNVVSSHKSQPEGKNKTLNISVDSTSSSVATPNSKPQKPNEKSSKSSNKPSKTNSEPQITFPPLSPSMTSSASMAGLNELLLQQAAAGLNPLSNLPGFGNTGSNTSANSLGLPFGGLGFNPFLMPPFGASPTPFPPLDEFLKQLGNGTVPGMPKLGDEKIESPVKEKPIAKESHKFDKKAEKERMKEPKEKNRDKGTSSSSLATTSSSSGNKKSSSHDKKHQDQSKPVLNFDQPNLSDQEKFMQDLMNYSQLASYPNNLFFNPLGFPPGASGLPNLSDTTSSSPSPSGLAAPPLDFSLLMNNPLLNPFLAGSGLPPSLAGGSSNDGKLSMELLAALSAVSGQSNSLDSSINPLDFLKPNDQKVKSTSKSSKTSSNKQSSSNGKSKSTSSSAKNTAPSPAPSNESYQGLDLSIKKSKQKNKEAE